MPNLTKSTEHRSKFAALRRQWWRLQMSEKFLEWDEKLQTNKYKTENSL